MSDLSDNIYRFAAEFNAGRQFNEFLKLFEKPDNRSLENSKTIIALKKLLDNSDFVTELPAETYLYRARVIGEKALNTPDTTLSAEKDGENYCFTGFDYYESKEPPLGMSPGQRNNYRGASYLYLAGDKYSAVAETKPLANSLISVAEFLTKKPLRIIDFAEDRKTNEVYDDDLHIPTLITRIMMQFSVPVQDENAYYPSQYISDYIRKYGFDGVKYRSWNSNGFCYTIFNCCEDNISFVSSEIVFVNAFKYSVYSLNDNEELQTPAGFDTYFNMCSDNEEEWKKIKEKIFNHLMRIKTPKNENQTDCV